MPVLTKHVLTRYLASECPKQLRLMLSPDSGSTRAEHRVQGMPPEQPPRPGLQHITRAGDDWAAEKLAELDSVLGAAVLIGQRNVRGRGNGVSFAQTSLSVASLTSAMPGTFLAEHEFDVLSTFQREFEADLLVASHGLGLGRLRPDLIEVRAPGTHEFACTPSGGVQRLSAGDSRVQLRVIDIKLTSNPGPGYLCEVVYYSIALAGWLEDHGLAASFAVSADPAIWPGSHSASAMVVARNDAAAAGLALTSAHARAALETDLVTFPFEVFASRLRHFFTEELPAALGVPWHALPYHVTTKCRGCDYLGQDRGPTNQPDPLHCQPTAEAADHLSRIAFLSKGAASQLTAGGSSTVGTVAALPPADPAFNRHHTLRGQRTVLSGRAAALIPGGQASIPQLAGTSATLPSWADLRVYVTADFDASSAITLAFGVKAWWRQPTRFGVAPPPGGVPTQGWQPMTFVVDDRSLVAEQDQLLAFLRQLQTIMRDVEARDQAAGTNSTVQFYLWDELTYRHLTRVLGRHLAAVLTDPAGIRNLAWLFPPEEVLGNDRLRSEPAVTIVAHAVKNLVALPVAHHYSLLATARAYHSTGMNPTYAGFHVPSQFEDPFSDQIPSERAHAIWTRVGGTYPWAQQLAHLVTTVKVRLNALEEVTKRLTDDLRGQLNRRAPRLTLIRPPATVPRLTVDESLIYAFQQLNEAVGQHKAAETRAMPPHQREAMFVSARLTRELTGQDRTNALARIGFTATPDQVVYEIRQGSEDAKIEEGAFTWSLVPESRVEILDWRMNRLVRNTPLNGTLGQNEFVAVSDVLNATVVRFDRAERVAVLELTSWNGRDRLRRDLVNAGVLDLSRDVSLEHVPRDFLGPKLKATLQAIGNTPKAVASPVAARALGIVPGGRGPRRAPRVPCEDILWDAAAMAAQASTLGGATSRQALEGAGHHLNASQWLAWEHALTHQLALIWGPPGTGKSRTLKNVVLGAALQAAQAGRSLRILITASTWTAVDNVLAPVAAAMPQLVPAAHLFRLNGQKDPVPGTVGLAIGRNVDAQSALLLAALTQAGREVVIVGSSAQQAHKLALLAGSPTAPLFDLIICDEASQADLANAVLPLATLAEHGNVVVAGDPLQLPPIRQVLPPEGTEALVGSLYAFLAEQHQVPQQPLETNYRSNAEIVSLAHLARYNNTLTAWSPQLRLNLLSPLPSGPIPPAGWPAGLAWSADLALLLDPDAPVVCVVHDDDSSGQSSDFEAQLVASLTVLLHDTMADGLVNERDPSGAVLSAGTAPYALDVFLSRGIGVVTPHRAQISKVVQQLVQVLPGVTAAQVRAAVDTVERYQGQQRDVIIGSYAVGDPDTIADEDEFLQSLNRFNVMASRARAKLVVILPQTLVQHLPTDLDVLRSSALLKAFAETHCHRRAAAELAWLDDQGALQSKRVSLRLP